MSVALSRGWAAMVLTPCADSSLTAGVGTCGCTLGSSTVQSRCWGLSLLAEAC